MSRDDVTTAVAVTVVGGLLAFVLSRHLPAPEQPPASVPAARTRPAPLIPDEKPPRPHRRPFREETDDASPDRILDR